MIDIVAFVLTDICKGIILFCFMFLCHVFIIISGLNNG